LLLPEIPGLPSIEGVVIETIEKSLRALLPPLPQIVEDVGEAMYESGLDFAAAALAGAPECWLPRLYQLRGALDAPQFAGLRLEVENARKSDVEQWRELLA
jgi:hypothetical protein